MSQLTLSFVPVDGIAREVITGDIQKYLGPEATVRPGIGDSGDYEGVSGYWYRAHSTLTSEMIEKLKVDTERWRKEMRAVAYTPSRFYDPRRCHWGPPPSVAQPNNMPVVDLPFHRYGLPGSKIQGRSGDDISTDPTQPRITENKRQDADRGKNPGGRASPLEPQSVVSMHQKEAPMGQRGTKRKWKLEDDDVTTRDFKVVHRSPAEAVEYERI